MLPDVSIALEEWKIPIIVKSVVQHTIDFGSADLITPRTIEAVVQQAQKEKLNADQINWSLRYIWIHTMEPVAVDEFIEYQGADYKIIDPGDWQAYGYSEAIAEETKSDLLVATFLLTYTAGQGGTLTGEAEQVVALGANGSAVTAVPDVGYTFVQWSDGVLTADRTDTSITSAVTVAAIFEAIP